MSWLFSQALAEEFLPASYLAIAPSAPSKSTPGPQAYSCDARMIVTYRRSRFGMTCALLTEDHGAALLTAYLEASRARMSVSPDLVRASKENDQDCGESFPASFAKWSRESCEWKTAHYSLLEDSGSYSETWPRSGLMRDGMCYPQPSLAQTIYANGSGSLLPTLAARDYRFPNAKSFAERGGGKKGEQLPNVLGGPLNPDWCELFMGHPIGWTASSVLETRRFHEWRQQHGDCLEANK